MSTTPLDMLQTKGQMQTQDLKFKQDQVTSLNKSNISPAEKEKKLREACEGFESIFIQKMWQQMRATLPQENPLVGREEKFWQSMYDQELAKEMASSGGIGLADMMYGQLSKNLAAVSKTTADAVSKSKGFEINATPLIPLQNTNLADSKSKQESSDMSKDAVAVAKANNAPVVPTTASKPETIKIIETTSPTGKSVTIITQHENKEAENPVQVAQVKPAQNEAHNIYEGSAPLMGNVPEGAKAENQRVLNDDKNSHDNNTIVEQYLANIQAKQVSSAAQNLPTGVERARNATLQASNTPPLHGVLPSPHNNTSTMANTTGAVSGHALQIQNAFVQPNASPANSGVSTLQTQAGAQSQTSTQPADSTQPHIIRTTYTTNLPANERAKRKSNSHYLTSGQPVVHNLATPAYPYGSKQVSPHGSQPVQNAANAPTATIIDPNAQQTAQNAAVQNAQAPVVGNTTLVKNEG